MLGFVQCPVGPADQLLGSFLAIPFGNAGRERLTGWHHGPQVVQDHDCLDTGAVAEHDRELFAAVAGQQVGAAHPGAPGSGGFLEEPIAALVAVVVVVAFEVIQVEQRDIEPAAVAADPGHLPR